MTVIFLTPLPGLGVTVGPLPMAYAMGFTLTPLPRLNLPLPRLNLRLPRLDLRLSRRNLPLPPLNLLVHNLGHNR